MLLMYQSATADRYSGLGVLECKPMGLQHLLAKCQTGKQYTHR